jgi:ketosteroid isomerase-like protein
VPLPASSRGGRQWRAWPLGLGERVGRAGWVGSVGAVAEEQGSALSEEVQACVDRVAIDHLQRAYADAVTARDWETVASLFRPDATVSLDLVERPGRELVGIDEIVGFIAPAVEAFSFFTFVILNSAIELWPGGDRAAAAARMSMCELRVRVGEQVRHDAFGRYLDRYERTDHGWRIAARRYRSLARFPDGVVHPLPGT